MASLLDLAQARLQGLLDIPTRAARAIVNPTAFSGLLGAPTLPQQQGMAEAAYGLPARQNMSVLDPNQAAYLQGYQQGEPLAYLGMATPFAAPAAVAGAKAVAPKAGIALENYMASQGLIQPLTAYHGTPHTIRGKFDISKVGTGEGAQSYGHGMYFAENPAVAKGYQQTLGKSELSVAGKDLEGAEKFVADRLRNSTYEDTLQWIDANKKAFGKEKTAEYKNILENLKNIPIESRTGNLYKVDIPDENIPNMLDWDKPLHEQSPQVKKALESLIQNPNTTGAAPWTFKDAIETMNAAPHTREIASINPTGAEIYKMLGKSNMVGNKAPGQAEASELLNSLGIKGIRYLDEGSRGNYRARTTYKGEPYGDIISFNTKSQLDDYIKQKKEEGFGVETFPQTSNFVVFDPKDVKILEKNSQKVEGLLD
jgi:hypothetical protein